MATEGTVDWARGVLSSGAPGVAQWNHWRERGPRYLDLSGIRLSEAVLVGVNLRGIKLWDAELDGADLSEALLAGAYLNRAKLHGACLDGANLGAANLRGADLSAVTVRGTQLKYALHLTQAQLDATVGLPATLPDDLHTPT
jgi:uncharacterized protein YjbI with pentapeptide repeats